MILSFTNQGDMSVRVFQIKFLLISVISKVTVDKIKKRTLAPNRSNERVVQTQSLDGQFSAVSTLIWSMEGVCEGVRRDL